ncbi:MAG: hypothetical protein ACTSYF_06860 [Promethearchaeota archaeon]
MESKHQKFHHTPSPIGMFMNFFQFINSLKRDKSDPSKCYACDQEKPIDDFRKVNQEFAQFPPDKFAFIIENLGLSGLDIAPEFFTDGSINICSECLEVIEDEYESPWINK